MSPRKRGQGEIEGFIPENLNKARDKRSNPRKNNPAPEAGQLRNLPWGGMGARVELVRLKGQTDSKHLKVPFRFMAPPLESWAWDASHNWTEFETMNNGQYARPSGKQLKTVAISTMFVDYHASWMVWPKTSDHINGKIDDADRFVLYNPLQRIRMLELLMHTGTPFMLRIGQEPLWERWDIGLSATLRSMHVEERAGEPDTRYVDLTFSEWRDLRLQRRQKGKPSKGTKGSGSKAKDNLPARVWIFRDGSAMDAETFKKYGDPPKRVATLKLLAKVYYGDPSKAARIRRANRWLKGAADNQDLGSVVRWLKRGRPQKLLIPEAPAGRPREVVGFIPENLNRR